MRRYLAAVAFLLFALGPAELVPTAVELGEEGAWDYSQFHSCTEKMLDRPGAATTQHNELVVVIDIVDGTCAVQLQVTLVQAEANEPISASVVLAYPESEPPLGESDSVPDLECPMVRRRSLDESLLNSEQMRQHLNSLKGMRISPVPEPILWLHGIHYTFWVSAVFAETEYRFMAPGSQQDSEAALDPLDAWIRELRSLLELDCSNLSGCPVTRDVGLAVDCERSAHP